MHVAEPTETPPRLHALIPCAGFGSRAGTAVPKQYTTIAGRSVLGHAIDAIARVTRIDSLVVVVHPDDAEAAAHLAGTRAVAVRCGGPTRSLTVRNGLEALAGRGADPDDWVLVHDAARCLIRPEWIDALIDACHDDPVGGLLALPLADTLKSERDGRVVATIDRHAKWQAQTPQMFRLGLLRRALASDAAATLTDEAGAVEALGLAPRLVPGALENLKVTWPADFELAERLLRSRSGPAGAPGAHRSAPSSSSTVGALWGRPGRRSGEGEGEGAE